MAVDLTEGAIPMLSSGNLQATDGKPVLQVMDVRPVQTSGVGGGGNMERYRVVLSDGSFHQQGVLATQRNYLVRSDLLQKGSVVQLTDFFCNEIHDRPVIVVIDLDLIYEKCDIIGDAIPCPLRPGGGTPPMAGPATPTRSSMNQLLSTVSSPESSTGSSYT